MCWLLPTHSNPSTIEYQSIVPPCWSSAMRLEIARYPVEHAVVGDVTRLDGRTLQVDVAGLRDRLAAIRASAICKSTWSRPASRFASPACLDLVEPRLKRSGAAPAIGRASSARRRRRAGGEQMLWQGWRLPPAISASGRRCATWTWAAPARATRTTPRCTTWCSRRPRRPACPRPSTRGASWRRS